METSFFPKWRKNRGEPPRILWKPRPNDRPPEFTSDPSSWQFRQLPRNVEISQPPRSCFQLHGFVGNLAHAAVASVAHLSPPAANNGQGDRLTICAPRWCNVLGATNAVSTGDWFSSFRSRFPANASHVVVVILHERSIFNKFHLLLLQTLLLLLDERSIRIS